VVSDTQYYSRYDDLYQVYTAIMNYAKDEYTAGNIGYVVNTGDLVDQTNVGDDIAKRSIKKPLTRRAYSTKRRFRTAS
jgi:translation elongation factor EF-4